jgi:ABC-type lipoprotein release transport system permease subunit
MNPLSTWTFYRRHRGRTGLLLGVISLATTGLTLALALSWAIFIEPYRLNYQFLSRFSMVLSLDEGGLPPGVVSQIRAHPDVAEVILTTPLLGISLPQAMGGDADWFNLLALMEEDVPAVLERCGATLKEGQMLQPRTNQVLLSEQVAAVLGLRVGESIHNRSDPERYPNIVDPMVVVGLLESDVRLGIVSYEYVASHERYRDQIAPQFLVVAHEGRQTAVEDFLLQEVMTSRTQVWTYQGVTRHMAEYYRRTYSLAIPGAVLVALAITLVVGAVNQMALSKRLSEFGILHATGVSKARLVRRLTLETAILASAGWAAGVGLAWLVLYILNATVFAPRGHELHVSAPLPVVFALLIPISLSASSLVRVRRVFSRLDAVAVVERGELSTEDTKPPSATTSRAQPLASRTFFGRHKRRAALLAGTTALMILAVVLVIFAFAAVYDAQKPNLQNLSHMSLVGPRPGSRLDPGVAAQIRAHPAVDRVIPVVRHMLLVLSIPPFGDAGVDLHAVYAEDLAFLVELYGLELEAGHLPHPRTNEIVIPKAVALNRDLQIGDVIGDPDDPIYAEAPVLPTGYVVSGIFARPAQPEQETWLSFVSLEFVVGHERYNFPAGHTFPLFVVPKAGQKDDLDRWLEGTVASDDVQVQTYRQQAARVREAAQSLMLSMALIESAVAAVAAVALAVLNAVFLSQRQSEFGLLHALGFGRPHLVRRTARETALTTAAAWCVSALGCGMALGVLQFGILTPLGLRLDPLNLTPWLYTLPIPVAVLVATSGTMARALSRLDPVSIIERRA